MSEGRREWRIVGNISAAHFVSHYYILVLPPLMPFLNRDLGIGITQLAIALSLFNLVTTVFQTPAGIIGDRIDRFWMLIAALLLGAASFAFFALVPTYWALLAAFAVGGLANAAYHPVDYAILSEQISGPRMSLAFSIHTFSGFVGFAAAPVSLVYIAEHLGWKAALWASCGLGVAVAVGLLAQRGLFARARRAHAAKSSTPAPHVSSLSLLKSREILRNTLIWVMLATASTGVQSYAVISWNALYGIPLDFANIALSGYLFATAIGVLIGGMVAGRTPRHDLVAAIGLGGSAVLLTVGGLFPLAPFLILIVAVGAGLLNGMVLPSRDLIVRSVSSPGTYARAFAIVSTGLSLGGIIAPVLFGLLYDHGAYRAIFLGIGVIYLFGVVLLFFPARRPITL
ncbi:MFS family permease [Rhodoligotrophos appendicifer]|uniref:MFS transporter n=1 Tax=Rhodoligotrophos appendicifer TaxID=987056 RepID=UPI0014793C95|nr:MFS transporter [Rhodoligotrophos appendicifer]